MPAAVPVIVGVADVVNHSTKVEDAREPADLMQQAIFDAIKDTGSPQAKTLQSAIDSIDTVNTWTWPYPDLPALLSQKLGVNAKHRYNSPHGGNQPGLLLDDAAKRISTGQAKVAVLTGGEALASCEGIILSTRQRLLMCLVTACAAAKQMPPPGWSQPSEQVDSVFSPTKRALMNNLGAVHDIGAPIHVYPLFENGYRAHRKQSIKDNNRESAKLYGDFAKVAEKNPYAWNYGKEVTEEFIGTVSKKNRMICFPYPMFMNTFNTVNLACAIILTSTDYAKEVGVPESKWIYPLGGAGTQDCADFWQRPNFHSSPSISRSIDAALEASKLQKTDIDIHDFYSCFPIVPKLAAHHLGINVEKPEKPITVLGGLTSFGGAGNNYSMHAFTELTRQLRSGKAKKALILCNGGLATYQHVVCISTTPRADGSAYPCIQPLPDVLTGLPVPEIAAVAEGEAVVETYTVEFGRDGKPQRGHVVGRLKKNGHRFVANHADAATLQQLSSVTEEPIGRSGYVKPDTERKGRNLFSFGKGSRL